jgi:hypothetical protein
MIGLPVLVKLLCLSAVSPSPVVSSPVPSGVLLLLVKGLSFSPISSGLLLLALALLLVLLVVRFYARKDTHLSASRKRLLLGLRIAAFMCVVLALLQPTVSLESQEGRRPRVFVLVDGSASMKLPFDLAARGDSSRSRADAALGVAQSLLKKLPRRFDTSLYVFSDSLRRIEGKQGSAISERFPTLTRSSISTVSAILNAPGSRTALGQALEDISARAGKTPAAVVVISDGASTFGPDPTRVAKRILLPVYSVLAANGSSFRDVEITEVLHPTSGYAGTEVPILIRVKGHGLENLDVPLGISEGENVVSRGMLKLAGSAENEILLSVKPVSAGLHFYKVSIPAVKGEASAVNNTASFALKVLSEKLKVIYLEGDLTWDFTFLKRQLESDPRLETTFALVSGRKMKLPTVEGFVSSAQVGLGRSSIVFIGDGAARYLGPDTWRSLDSFVSSGGGLFIAGAGGLNEIPASAQKLLPAQLLGHDAWGPQEYLNCRLTFDGLNHPICDIEKEASSNANSWKEISPLLGSHVIDSAKPGASVLVESSTGNKSFPVIVAGSYGKGRVLLVAASGFWRWGFSLPGAGGSDRLFSGFTSNAIWWLSEAEKDKLPDMKPQSWVFENGEEVIFSGRGALEGATETVAKGAAARTAGGVGKASYPKLEVTDKNGKSLSPVYTQRASSDSLTVSFGALEPGTYDYKTSYEEKGERTVSAGSFLVDANGPEYRNLFPDSRLLTYVSEASGGKFFTTDQVDVLAREIQTFGEKATVERQVKLWNHPLLFLAFTMFVAIEWWLRRRSGLP